MDALGRDLEKEKETKLDIVNDLFSYAIEERVNTCEGCRGRVGATHRAVITNVKLDP